MAERKTNETAASVDEFIDAIKDESKREDSRAITKLMAAATGAEPKMWGTSIVGFGKLGKHKYSGGCLHIARLADVQIQILTQMIESAYRTSGRGGA